MKAIRLPPVLFCAALILLGACQPSPRVIEPTPAPPLHASGVFGADEVLVSAQTAGTVESLAASEGETVAQGDVVARLDTALIDAQIGQAQAALQTAQAQLAKVQEGVRPEEIALAEAAARRADVEVTAAEKSVEVAKATVASAQVTLQAARAEQARIAAGVNPLDTSSAEERAKTAQDSLTPLGKMRDDVGGQEQGGTRPKGSYDAAQATVAQAELSAEIARLQAENLASGVRPTDLQAAKAAVDAAQALVTASESRVQEAAKRVEAARARARQAHAQAELLKAGASPEQLAVAEAPVRMADAAVRVLQVRRDQATMTAPISGVVLERNASVGEQVLAGAVLYRLSDLKVLDLTVYVPGADVSRVHAGQDVKVTASAYPSRTFDGTVVHVAPQAEFTPDVRGANSAGAAGSDPSAGPPEASSSEVFAVQIRVPNPDGALGPGMPAGVTFGNP